MDELTAARAATIERGAEAARAKWLAIAPQAPERLIVPGSPGFRCQPVSCDALCCGAPYLAGTSERDVAALHAAGHETIEFLDIDPGELSELFAQGQRWSQIVTLRQDEAGRCTFLQPDLSCGVYGARPDGCALYPYRLVFVPVDGDQILTTAENVDALDLSVRQALGRGDDQAEDEAPAEYVPLVLRDMSCPGFTEDQIDSGDYAALLARIWELDGCSSHARACERHESF